MMVFRFGIIFFIAVCLLVCPAAYAQDKQSDLQAQIEELQERISELEAVLEEVTQEHRDPMQRRIRPRVRDPFRELEIMQDRMDEAFDSSQFNWNNRFDGIFLRQNEKQQRIQLRPSDEGYDVVIDVKGIPEEQLEIDISDGAITVKGKWSKAQKTTEPNSTSRFESTGSFVNVLPLPVDADSSRATTKREKNQLIISIPKK